MRGEDMKKKLLTLSLVSLLALSLPVSAKPHDRGHNPHHGPAHVRMVAPPPAPHHHFCGSSFTTGVLARRGCWSSCYYYGYPINGPYYYNGIYPSFYFGFGF